jgi:hypothetical protein
MKVENGTLLEDESVLGFLKKSAARLIKALPLCFTKHNDLNCNFIDGSRTRSL